VGLFFRLYRIGVPSLWFDELLTAGRIQVPFREILHDLSHSPFPPLYYLLMRGWSLVAGISEWTLRFPSALFSSASVWAVYLFGKELYDRKTALIAALFLSVSPYAVYYGQEAKMYSMLWFLGSFSFYFFYRLLKNGRKSDALLYVLCTVAAIYTLYAGFVFLITQLCLLFVWPDRRHRKAGGTAIALTLVFFLPWLPVFLEQARNRTGIRWIGEVDRIRFFFSFFREISSGVGHGSPLWKVLKQIFAAGYLCLASAALIPPRKNHGFLFAMIAVPLAAFYLVDLLFQPILIVRYMGWIHIPLALLAAYSVNRCSRIVRPALVLLAVSMCVGFWYVHTAGNLKNIEDWRNLFERLRIEEPPPEKAVLWVGVFSPPGYQAIANRGLKIYHRGVAPEIVHRNFFSKEAFEKQNDAPGTVFLIYRKMRPEDSPVLPFDSLRGYQVSRYETARVGFLKFTNLTDDA
jgi:uncharacterized membrane protein